MSYSSEGIMKKGDILNIFKNTLNPNSVILKKYHIENLNEQKPVQKTLYMNI